MVAEWTREQARERLGRFMPAQVLDGLLALWAASVGTVAPVTDAVERVTGHPARPFGQWAAEHRAAFTG